MTGASAPFVPITSFVQTGAYATGEIVFPLDGIVTFDSDVTVQIVDGALGAASYFTGGQV